MNERLIPIASFYLDGASDADGVCGVYVPQDVRITHVSSFVTITGGPSAATIDIQDDTVDTAILAQSIATNGLHNVTDVEVASGSVLELDLNLTGGTSPTATGEVVLWGYVGE